MNRIILLYGGNSVEHEISIITALQLKKSYKGKFNLCLCYLKNGYFYMSEKLEDLSIYKKNNFEKHLKKVEFKANQNYIFYNHKKISFLGVYLIVHGLNCEDGTLYSYFNTLNIPVIGENIYSASIGQNKIYSKMLTSVDSVPFFKITRNEATFHLKDIFTKVKDFNYPLIIKPSTLGSSIGVYSVDNDEQLEEKMTILFHLCDEIIVEKKIENFIELNIAVLKIQDKIILSSIEKVSNNKVLTYEDKYINEKKSMECLNKELPAVIDDDLAYQIQDSAIKIYEDLNAKFIVRIDFLYDLKQQKLFFNEINNIPGSLALYLFKNKGYDVNNLIDQCLEEGLFLNDLNLKKLTTYDQNIFKANHLNQIKLEK